MRNYISSTKTHTATNTADNTVTSVVGKGGLVGDTSHSAVKTDQGVVGGVTGAKPKPAKQPSSFVQNQESVESRMPSDYEIESLTGKKPLTSEENEDIHKFRSPDGE